MLPTPTSGTAVPGRPTDRVPDHPPAAGIGDPLPDGDRRPVTELVAEHARTRPGHPAVRSGGSTLGYAELDAWARRIAAQLAAAGAGPGERVAVLVSPSTAMVAAALGVLRSGAAYVPLDRSWPDRRLADVLADARVRCAVVDGQTGDRLTGSGMPVIRADGDPATRGEGPDGDRRPLPPIAAGDPAYLIYTSGSTGEPKGVLVEHGQLAASTLARRLVYPGAAVFLLLSPLAFDSSVAGLWGTLTSGGTLVVATAEQVRDPERLVELVDRERVTATLCVPSLYGVLLDAAERLGRQRLSSLDTVVVAGEPLPEPLLHRHVGWHGRRVALVNEYGPTETTVWASYRRYDTAGPVTIGGPIPGARLYVLDEDGRPVPPGTEGELHVGGAGVSAGYFGRPEATAAAFRPDPWTEGGRMYRTGDRARWTAEGTLEFLGRRDHQVKIRGHRVELGAVEAALRTVPGVRDAAVVPDAAGAALTGFLLAEEGTAADAVRGELAEQVPAAMVPARLRVVEHFPLTFSGKVDRGQLAAAAEEEQRPDSRGSADPAAPSRPSRPSRRCRRCRRRPVGWCRRGLVRGALGPRGAGRRELFRRGRPLADHVPAAGRAGAAHRRPTVGGDAVRAHHRLRTGPVHPDVRLGRPAAAARSQPGGGPAGAGGAGPAAAGRPGAVVTPGPDRWLDRPVTDPDARRRLACLPHAGGSAAFFRDWGGRLPGTEVLAVRYPGRAERIDEPSPTDLRRLGRQVAAVLAELADLPLTLFGHSMGAVVALEAARSLQERGRPPAHLVASGSRNAPLPPAEPPGEQADADLLAQLAAMGGTDPELLADPSFQELVLPYVRSDGEMFHRYEHRREPILRCGVTTVVGADDPDADRRPWAELTDGGFAEHVVPGDHFYLVDRPPYAVLDQVLGAVAEVAR